MSTQIRVIISTGFVATRKIALGLTLAVFEKMVHIIAAFFFHKH
jgi:uncharacterized membrane protein